MKPEDKSGKDKGKRDSSKGKEKEKDKGKDKDKDKAKGKEPSASPKPVSSPPKPAVTVTQPPSSPKPAAPVIKPPNPASPNLAVPVTVPTNAPIEFSKERMPPGQPPSSPKPPDSKPSDASAVHASPSAEKSPSESAPKPADAGPGHPSPSADAGPAPPGTKPEQAVSASDSATTQPSKPSDSPSPPSMTTTTAAPSPPSPPAAPPPKAPAAPPPKAAASATKAAAAPAPSQPSRGGLVGFDESFSKKLAIWTSDGWAKSVMKAFVRGTHAVAWLIWMPVIILSTPPASSLREQLVNLYRGIIWTGIVVLILRVVCKRPKPPKLDGSDPSPYSAYTDLYSFPSNSSAMTMLACRFLTVNYGDGTVTLVATLLVILVALAVLTLGRHYLFDVIVGWIIGIVIFCVSKRMWIPMDKCDQHVKRILDALHI